MCTSSKSPPLARSPVIVVGAGPAGLSSALLLSIRGHRVTLVDRLPPPSELSGDLTRAFSYLISLRAQRLLKTVPRLWDAVAEASVSSTAQLAMFPARGPAWKKAMGQPEGEKGHRGRVPGVWVGRRKFLELLEDEVRARDDVQLRFRQGVVGVRGVEGGVEVAVQDEEGRVEVHAADLVVAADGVRGAVRRCLDGEMEWNGDWGSTAGNEISGCGTGSAVARHWESRNGFGVDSWENPSTVLLYKTVTLPPLPKFKMDSKIGSSFGGVSVNGEGAEEREGHVELTIDPNNICAFRGDVKGRSRTEVFNMGALPVGTDVSGGRTGTIVLRAEHELWQDRSVEETYALFQKNFPQILDIQEVIGRKAMERFASTKPSKFPRIQRVRSLVGLVEGRAGGVVFVGDAAHCFPPDLGQGVNSALDDVLVLCRHLDKAAEEGRDLVGALAAYEEERHEDIDALMRLQEIGAPYQYGQSKVGVLLWALNQKLRAALVSLAPGVFHHQVFSIINDDLRYSEVLQRVDDTTKRIWLLFSLGCVPIVAWLALWSR